MLNQNQINLKNSESEKLDEKMRKVIIILRYENQNTGYKIDAGEQNSNSYQKIESFTAYFKAFFVLLCRNQSY